MLPYNVLKRYYEGNGINLFLLYSDMSVCGLNIESLNETVMKIAPGVNFVTYNIYAQMNNAIWMNNDSHMFSIYVLYDMDMGDINSDLIPNDSKRNIIIYLDRNTNLAEDNDSKRKYVLYNQNNSKRISLFELIGPYVDGKSNNDADRCIMVKDTEILSLLKLSAVLCLLCESRPFCTSSEIIEEISDMNKSKIYYEPIDNYGMFENKSFIQVLSDYYDIDRYKDLLNKNIVGRIDPINGDITIFDNEFKEGEKHDVYVVNPLEYKRTKINNKKFVYKYIGLFDDVDSYRGICLNSEEIATEINTPIVLITGIGNNCGKFLVELEMKRQLAERELISNFEYITYNPLGVCFDMNYLCYRKEISFSKQVLSINNFIKGIEIHKNPDCIFFNSAGGMGPLNRRYTNDFGELFYATLQALHPDYIVICTNSGVDANYVKTKIEILKAEGYLNIYVYIHNFSYDEYAISTVAKAYVHKEDKTIFEIGKRLYQDKLGYDAIYDFEDIVSGRLLDNIIG